MRVATDADLMGIGCGITSRMTSIFIIFYKTALLLKHHHIRASCDFLVKSTSILISLYPLTDGRFAEKLLTNNDGKTV